MTTPWVEPQNLIGIALVLVGGVTGAFIAWQAKESAHATKAMRDSVKVVKDKERARLFVSPKQGDDGFNDFNDCSFLDGPTIGIEITQHGPTKAFNVRCRGCVSITQSKEPLPAKPSDIRDMTIPNVIEGGASPLIAQTSIFPFTQEQADAIRQETSFLHFFGFISYEDVFGDKQRTTFRYIWIPAQYLDVPEAEPSSVLIDEAGWEKNGGESENYAS
jgi:hypothetical protein